MDLRHADDTELARRRRQDGDHEALAELIRRRHDRVRAVVYLIVLDHAAADDVTQEVFVRVIRGIDRYQGDASFTTWIHRIAVNASYDHLRREARRRDARLPDADPVDPAASPGEAAGLRELHEQIDAAVARLSPKLRAALSLVVLHGTPAAEAAEAEGCPVSTIHWRVHEARRQLKALLGPHLSPDPAQ